jgi:hypothetical protein
MAGFEYNRVEDGIPKSSYDDKKMRKLFIEFAKNTLNVEYISGTEFGIDLIRVDKPTCGAEGENASWEGDRWVSDQCNIFNRKYNTLNIQNRKWHYWGLSEWSSKNMYRNNKTHPGFEENIYFRINSDGDQICIVDSKTIREQSKIDENIVLDRTVNNSYGPEDWICIPQEYVMTYNKQTDGTWVLNGKYCGLTDEERLTIKRLKAANAYSKVQEKLNK